MIMRYVISGRMARKDTNSTLSGSMLIGQDGVCSGQLHIQDRQRESYHLEGRVTLKKVKQTLPQEEQVHTLWPNGREAPSIQVRLSPIEEYILLEITASSTHKGIKNQSINMVNLVPQRSYAGTYYTQSLFMGREAILDLSEQS